jgi:hypothetical protein
VYTHRILQGGARADEIAVLGWECLAKGFMCGRWSRTDDVSTQVTNQPSPVSAALHNYLWPVDLSQGVPPDCSRTDGTSTQSPVELTAGEQAFPVAHTHTHTHIHTHTSLLDTSYIYTEFVVQGGVCVYNWNVGRR